MKMKFADNQIYEVINSAIDLAVTSEKYNLNFYTFLKSSGAKRQEVISFLNSPLTSQIKDEISYLNLYITDSPEISDIQEVYDWMGKSRAKKYKEYLLRMIEDAEKYEREKRPGRKPGTKNKKVATTSNK
jgi:hypothetical protein